MATIRQRTSGYWQAIVRRKGAPDQSKTFRKKKDAEAWAATIESEIARGVFVSRDEAEKTTFAKVAERFEEEVLPNKRSGDRDVYRLRQVVEHFGKHTLAAITSSMIAAYLAEFLSDHRVVEIPRLVWWFILHGIILRFRPAKSAAKYASVWTPQGSPLKVWTEKQAKLLQGWLGQRNQGVGVRWAMRYGSTSIASQLDALKAEGVTRVLVVPAYPQYSAARRSA